MGTTCSRLFFQRSCQRVLPGWKACTPARHVKYFSIPRLLKISGPDEGALCDLENILSLLCHPKELRCLDKTILLPRCMYLLRDITGRLDLTGSPDINSRRNTSEQKVGIRNQSTFFRHV